MDENLIVIMDEDLIRILEEIQLESYNLNRRFEKLNEELVSDVISGSAITVNQSIKKIDNNINLLTAVLIIYVILQLVKMRGDRLSGK